MIKQLDIHVMTRIPENTMNALVKQQKTLREIIEGRHKIPLSKMLVLRWKQFFIGRILERKSYVVKFPGREKRLAIAASAAVEELVKQHPSLSLLFCAI